MVISIYLSGGIKKGDRDKDKLCWEESDKEKIREKLGNVVFFNPQERGDDLGDSFAVFGRDLLQTSSAQFIIVDGRMKRGVGVGTEMLLAKMKKIPVISIIPKNTHYHRDNLEALGQTVEDWTHPFFVGLCDGIVENLDEACEWIKECLENPKPIKGEEVVEQAINHYKERFLDQDEEMKDVLEKIGK